MFFWKKINEQCIEESCNEYDINNSKVGASLASEGGGKPPNIREIGRASWLYLHSMANKYPESPDETIKKRYNDWIRNFSDVYPCKTCRNGMKKLIHEFPPRLGNR
ncbi:Erv1 Alr family [Cryptosporidium bovis]|uniref:Erv1 Alr family n=1 Tax=Cryptosporidium bovis TaxID=310047 RepID=UPI00351A1E6A|nr:Erv1 Alr family [Cryptosporidium bovis]